MGEFAQYTTSQDGECGTNTTPQNGTESVVKRLDEVMPKAIHIPTSLWIVGNHLQLRIHTAS